MTISPAPASAAPNAVSVLYGLAVPVLTGTLTGILPQDTSKIALALTSPAVTLSTPGSYPITATLAGTAAGNYALTQSPAAVTVTQAPTATTLSNSLGVHVASTTAGTPTGTVTLLDAANLYTTATLSATGDAQFSPANLSVGTHTVTASYSGDKNFLSSSSSPYLDTIGGAANCGLRPRRYRPDHSDSRRRQSGSLLLRCESPEWRAIESYPVDRLRIARGRNRIVQPGLPAALQHPGGLHPHRADGEVCLPDPAQHADLRPDAPRRLPAQ